MSDFILMMFEVPEAGAAFALLCGLALLCIAIVADSRDIRRKPYGRH